MGTRIARRNKAHWMVKHLHGVLGISTFIYLPYCFFNLISPIMTLIFAYGNIKIAKLGTDKVAN